MPAVLASGPLWIDSLLRGPFLTWALRKPRNRSYDSQLSTEFRAIEFWTPSSQFLGLFFSLFSKTLF